MIDHIGLNVKDYKQSKAFYVKALAPLGYKLLLEFDDNCAGFGTGKRAHFWIMQREPVSTSVHVAFDSADRETVQKFHTAALEVDGRDNGAPGLRSHYHANYYSAFVFDPDGNNIEAVCHKSE